MSLVTAEDFVRNRAGTFINLLDNPAYGNECVAAFWKFNLEVNRGEGYAAEVANDLFDLDWETYYKVSPEQQFRPGDWLIWSGVVGAYTNFTPSLGRGAGHIAMFLRDNGDGTALCASQNPNRFQEMTLSLNGVRGALRMIPLTDDEEFLRELELSLP